MLSHREEVPGEIDARLDPKLMRRHAEHRLELPDEVKGRDLQLARDVLD